MVAQSLLTRTSRIGDATDPVKDFMTGTADRCRLDSDGTIRFQPDNTTHTFGAIYPDPSADTQNVPFYFSAASFDNGVGQRKNFVVRMGHNRKDASGAVNALFPQNVDEWECGYRIGGRLMIERHLIAQGTYGEPEQRWLSAFIRADAAPTTPADNAAGFQVDQVVHLDRLRVPVFQSDANGFRHEYGGTFVGTLRQETGSGQALTAPALGVGAFGVWQSYFTAGGSLQVLPKSTHTPSFSAEVYKKNAVNGSFATYGTGDALAFYVEGDGPKFPMPTQSRQATATTNIDSSWGEYKNATSGVPLTTVEQFTRTFAWNGSDGTTLNAALYFRAFQSHATASHGGYSLGEYTSGEFARFDVMGSARRMSVFGVTPQARQTVNAAAADPAETMALVNQLRAALVGFGFCQ